MPTLLIVTDDDYCTSFDDDDAKYRDNESEEPYTLAIGYLKPRHYRSCARFPLNNLPSDAQISQVRVRMYVVYPSTSSSHLLEIYCYGSNGQDDPANDSLLNRYAKSNGAGNQYYEGGNLVDGEARFEWKTLGGQIATDIMNAKNAVNRFSLALFEYGDNDARAQIRNLEAGGSSYALALEITYTVPTAPTGYSYSDGLVCVQVAG